MSIDPDTAEKQLRSVRRASHVDCVACSSDAVLGLRCSTRSDGSVATEFRPARWMAGYDGLLHGGIVATALDAAATQCLFAHGVDGLTALLNIRYRRPAPIDQTFQLQAWLESASGGRFRLRAELRTDQTRVADAEAVFVKRKSASGQASTSLAVSPS